jgi:hypothetical protein
VSKTITLSLARKELKVIDVLVIVLLYLYLFFILPIYRINLFQPSILISILFVLTFVKNKSLDISKNETIKFFLIFFLWTSFCSILATNSDAAIKTQGKLLVVFFLMYIVYDFAKKSINHVFVVYIIYIALIPLLTYGVIKDEGFGALLNARQSSLRNKEFNEWEYDPNTLGYFVFFGTNFAFIIFSFVKKNLTNKIVLGLLIVLSFFLVLYSASRGAFVIFTALVLLSVSVIALGKKLDQKGYLVVYFIFAAIIASASVGLIQSLIQDSALEQRLEQDNEETTRRLHITEAFNVGLSNPIMGVGGGNYAYVPRSFEQGSFSHCSYTEAFANYGIFGLALLIFLYFKYFQLLRKCFKNKAIQEKEVLYYLGIFLVCFIVYNVFYVTYLTVEFMGAYIAAYVHLVHLNRKEYQAI